ncbi:hypothetical protein KO525_03985 [Psychrosphaera sp. B3R10]|uniref:Outer membrane protein beta-barrel domain-containing protein n=1 Tax=Psychrosphaera algicola TaxID=3023714 RepID=A0ABT5FFS9_9GAMM|nr:MULTISPECIES: hypothetical protein [unclassified Psychrosphaera]MBU2883077.1 hypothetical protein [Psychrosphaera sp. I2R16]MBU2988534.1 hypothetical protein [Psychrosphaera sp. B3R10]MDC2890416.1 hypothetical protein [Psychrosphaera sp. G1-22]MDO6719595.1 hypothetical protein [Psychrosphaera sp. 1_MG-2023]
MKKLTLLLATVLASNAYANQGSLDATVAFQGDYSGIALNYETAAPNYIENTKNGYYEGTLVYLSGDVGDTSFSHTLIGLSYGIGDKLNNQFNWFAQLGLGYVNNNVDFSIMGNSSSVSDSGIELLGKLGISSSLNDKIDYKAYVALEDDTVLGINAIYKHSEKLKFIAKIETFSDSRLAFGVNYQF